MKKFWLAIPLLSLLVHPAVAQEKEEKDDKEESRIENAGKVFKEILDAPDSIPQDVLDKADCVVTLPSVLKFAIGFGGSYGRGVMTCRGGSNFNGPWGPPTMMALEGGSAGLQFGGNATDFVPLLMSPRSATSMLSSKVKLGSDATAAAESDVALRSDNSGNKKLYNTTVSAEDIVFKHAVRVPPSAKVLLTTLEKASPKNKSNK